MQSISAYIWHFMRFENFVLCSSTKLLAHNPSENPKNIPSSEKSHQKTPRKHQKTASSVTSRITSHPYITYHEIIHTFHFPLLFPAGSQLRADPLKLCFLRFPQSTSFLSYIACAFSKRRYGYLATVARVKDPAASSGVFDSNRKEEGFLLTSGYFLSHWCTSSGHSRKCRQNHSWKS